MTPSKRDVVVWSVLTLGALVLVGLGIWRRSAPVPRPPLRVFAQLPEFELTNRDGTIVGREDLAGAPWIADFIFTRCAGICPFMTRRMRRLADDIPAAVRLVSITVDPEHDTPQVLDEYARRHQAPDSWYFLTGPLDDVRSLSRDGFLLGVEAAAPADPNAGDEPIVHSNRFVLVDGSGNVRGYYDAFDETEIERLRGDVGQLLDARL